MPWFHKNPFYLEAWAYGSIYGIKGFDLLTSKTNKMIEELNTAGLHRAPEQLPCVGRFLRKRPGAGSFDMLQRRTTLPWPRETGAQRCKGAGPDLEPGPSLLGPHGTDLKAKPQQQALARTIKGHGHVLLLGELWQQDECCLTVQDILEQDPTHRPTELFVGPSHSGHGSSSNSAPGTAS